MLTSACCGANKTTTEITTAKLSTEMFVCNVGGGWWDTFLRHLESSKACKNNFDSY